MPFKGLSGFVLGSFLNGMSNLKDLVGSFWVRFGFVFSVKLLIPGHVLASFARFHPFSGNNHLRSGPSLSKNLRTASFDPSIRIGPFSPLPDIRSNLFNSLTALFLQRHKFHPPSPVTGHRPAHRTTPDNLRVSSLFGPLSFRLFSVSLRLGGEGEFIPFHPCLAMGAGCNGHAILDVVDAQ